MAFNQKKIILVILDGWGIAPPGPGNMIEAAQTPIFDSLKKKYSYTELCASSLCVGLIENQPGNSEAGHLNLGAGRIIKDDAVLINESIGNGTFFKNPAFIQGLKHQKKYQSKVHLMGLITEENSAHSHPFHWQTMLKFLAREKVPQVYLHLFTDGRDSSQHAALKIIERFEEKLKLDHQEAEMKIEFATVIGRFYAMDRTKNWENIKKAYELLVFGRGLKTTNIKEAILSAYNRQETDEFISPTVIMKEARPNGLIKENDLVIFMNLRSDRARQLTKVFVQTDFEKKNKGAFKREKIKNLFFIALTDFGPDLNHTLTAYPSRDFKNTLPFCLKGLKQYYLAETEKFAHVTFFFNGGYDHPVVGEKRECIPSVAVSHYDLKPEMSALRLTERAKELIEKKEPNFILVNFANPDMLGHTGNMEAAKKGIEVVDECLGEIFKVVKKKNYLLIVTADHGNAEEMINSKTGEIETTHTTNPVPFIIIDKKKYHQLAKKGVLANVAPTILDLFGIEKPKEMIDSLIKR